MKMEQTECSETSAYKIQTPGITHKKTYNIQNTAKVWNKKFLNVLNILTFQKTITLTVALNTLLYWKIFGKKCLVMVKLVSLKITFFCWKF